MGIPMGLQYSITAIGSVILQTSVNNLGSDVVASVAAGSKISAFLCCPFDALGSTMAVYAGQNVGARKLERISQGIKSSIINSGATALDCTGAAKNESGEGCMKSWWDITESDIDACTDATDWCRANYEYFRGGGFSSHFKTQAEMPVTMLRVNIVEGVGPVIQIAEGKTAVLEDEVHNTLDVRTDRS